MARETRLWVWLSKARKFYRADLHMDRVENSLMSGMPDVHGHLKNMGSFWIELKSAQRPRNNIAPVRFKVRDREAQVHWMRRHVKAGGRAWLLLQVGSGHGRRIYLVHGSLADEVYQGRSEAWLRDNSVLGRVPVEPPMIIAMAATGPNFGSYAL